MIPKLIKQQSLKLGHVGGWGGLFVVWGERYLKKCAALLKIKDGVIEIKVVEW